MTHKDFYFWLQGYLHGRLENKHIEITPIIEKMSKVKDEFDFNNFIKMTKKQKYNEPIIVDSKEQLNDRDK